MNEQSNSISESEKNRNSIAEKNDASLAENAATLSPETGVETIAKEEVAEQINSEAETLHLIKWQRGLLPLMSILLIGLTIFFLGASIFQLYGLKSSITASPQSTVETEMEYLRPNPNDLPNNNFERTRWATLVRLEANSIERRYHQANTASLARVWTIYLGFLTGMILSLVGASFILGKMRETSSKLDVGTSDWKAAVESSSPGIILTVLGTTLMIVTLFARADIQVNDSPLYVTDVGVVSQKEGEDQQRSNKPSNGSDRVTVNGNRSATNAQDNLDDAERKLNQNEASPNPVNKSTNMRGENDSK